MMGEAFWQPGETTLLRFRRQGIVSVVHPVTVVQDGPDATQLYLQPGTPLKKRVRPDGSPIPRDMPYAERSRLPHVVGDAI